MKSSHLILSLTAECGFMPEVCLVPHVGKTASCHPTKQAHIRRRKLEPMVNEGLIVKKEVDGRRSQYTKACRRYYQITKEGLAELGIKKPIPDKFSSSSWRHEVAVIDGLAAIWVHYTKKGCRVDFHFNATFQTPEKNYTPDALITVTRPNGATYDFLYEAEVKKDVDKDKINKILYVLSHPQHMKQLDRPLSKTAQVIFLVGHYQSDTFQRPSEITPDRIEDEDHQLANVYKHLASLKDPRKDRFFLTTLYKFLSVHDTGWLTLKTKNQPLIQHL